MELVGKTVDGRFDVLAPIACSILGVADTIADAPQRERFLARPLAKDRIVPLAHELGVA